MDKKYKGENLTRLYMEKESLLKLKLITIRKRNKYLNLLFNFV